MRKGILVVFSMIIINGLVAQNNLDQDLNLFNKTWKSWSHQNLSGQFTCTSGSPKIIEDNILVIPQCYEFDHYFKVMFVSEQTLVLEKYIQKKIKKNRKVIEEKLVPTGEFFYFKESKMDALTLQTLQPSERVFYMRLEQ